MIVALFILALAAAASLVCAWSVLTVVRVCASLMAAPLLGKPRTIRATRVHLFTDCE
jgi:hypothetical protein